MIGDRLNTDIEFGKAGGLATLLVLTGASRAGKAKAACAGAGRLAYGESCRHHEGERDYGPQCVAHRARLRDEFDRGLARAVVLES